MVTKHDIINGVIKFIETDMAKASGATTSKLIVLLAKNVLKKNEAVIDSFLENPIAKTLLTEQDGMYDLSTLMSVLKDTANEMGCISLSIPKVPFLLPEGDEIRLSVSDINTINDYINEEAGYMHDNMHTPTATIPEVAPQKVALNA